jgi:hypothetical protein
MDTPTVGLSILKAKLKIWRVTAMGNDLVPFMIQIFYTPTYTHVRTHNTYTHTHTEVLSVVR